MVLRPENQRRWNHNFKKLQKYIKQYGTWRVKKEHDISLSQWLKRQKRNYQNLSLERRRKLEHARVSGVYQAYYESWKARYDELRLFKKVNGHLVVGKQNKSLFEWIQNQKWMKNQGKLTRDRESALDRIGFVWSGEIAKKRNEHWESMFKKFKQLKRKHGVGYILILRDFKDLHSWVDSQKHNKRKLSKDRLGRLNRIQFPWSTRDLQVIARSKAILS